MTRRVLAAITAAVLVLSTAAQASGHTTGYLHYSAPCDDFDYVTPLYNAIGFVSRPIPNASGAYKAVKGTATVISLHACTYNAFLDGGWSLVNVANAQASVPYELAQLGYAQQACGTQHPCQDTFQNGQTDFWWTPDHTPNRGPQGDIARATWVNFNGGAHDSPVLGDRYSFEIKEATVEGVTNYTYCITVVSSSTYPVGAVSCTSSDRRASYFTTASWGLEVWSDASAFGSNGSSAAQANITPLQYMNWNGSIYSTVTGGIDGSGTSACNWVVANGPPPGVHWASEHCVVSGGTGQSTLYGYTAQHS